MDLPPGEIYMGGATSVYDRDSAERTIECHSIVTPSDRLRGWKPVPWVHDQLARNPGNRLPRFTEARGRIWS